MSKKGDFWSEKIFPLCFLPRNYWNYLNTLIHFQCYTSMGLEQCLMSFFLKLLPSAAITNGDKNRTLARKLRFRFCVYNFLSILSDFRSREKLTQKQEEPKVGLNQTGRMIFLTGQVLPDRTEYGLITLNILPTKYGLSIFIR